MVRHWHRACQQAPSGALSASDEEGPWQLCALRGLMLEEQQVVGVLKYGDMLRKEKALSAGLAIAEVYFVVEGVLEVQMRVGAILGRWRGWTASKVLVQGYQKLLRK
jgi:hypothetical protein